MGIHYDVGSRRNQRDVKGGAQKRMQRTPRKEKVVPVHTADGLLFAHYEKGYNRFCEKVS